MTWLIVTVCFGMTGFAVLWFSPLRKALFNAFSHLDRYKFTCRVEEFSDESMPVQQDRFFCVQMIGQIPTDRDNVDTDVQLEILDITDGRTHPQQVLSSDEQYRLSDSADFYFQQHNGAVPQKNAVLARWITVAQFPCHILRFAYRGRRKLLFRVTILERETGHELTTACKQIEYVCCSDGYREVHGRRRDVLQACLRLAAVVAGGQPPSKEIREHWSNWLGCRTDKVISADEALQTIDDIQNTLSPDILKKSSEIILAYGHNTDRFAAMELALQTAGMSQNVTRGTFNRLVQISQLFEIKKDRFLETAQKILLSSNCQIDDPSQLLGLKGDMDEASFKKRLNEEYRKWNARVTHPDAQIREQAGRILTLIADIRSRQLSICS